MSSKQDNIKTIYKQQADHLFTQLFTGLIEILYQKELIAFVNNHMHCVNSDNVTYNHNQNNNTNKLRIFLNFPILPSGYPDINIENLQFIFKALLEKFHHIKPLNKISRLLSSFLYRLIRKLSNIQNATQLPISALPLKYNNKSREMEDKKHEGHMGMFIYLIKGFLRIYKSSINSSDNPDHNIIKLSFFNNLSLLMRDQGRNVKHKQIAITLNARFILPELTIILLKQYNSKYQEFNEQEHNQQNQQDEHEEQSIMNKSDEEIDGQMQMDIQAQGRQQLNEQKIVQIPLKGSDRHEQEHQHLKQDNLKINNKDYDDQEPSLSQEQQQFYDKYQIKQQDQCQQQQQQQQNSGMDVVQRKLSIEESLINKMKKYLGKQGQINIMRQGSNLSHVFATDNNNISNLKMNKDINSRKYIQIEKQIEKQIQKQKQISLSLLIEKQKQKQKQRLNIIKINNNDNSNNKPNIINTNIVKNTKNNQETSNKIPIYLETPQSLKLNSGSRNNGLKRFIQETITFLIRLYKLNIAIDKKRPDEIIVDTRQRLEKEIFKRFTYIFNQMQQETEQIRDVARFINLIGIRNNINNETNK